MSYKHTKLKDFLLYKYGCLSKKLSYYNHSVNIENVIINCCFILMLYGVKMFRNVSVVY